MQLEGFESFDATGDDRKLVYRCMRKHGYTGRTGETYTGDCYYHEHPYPAADYSYWHRDPDAPKGKHKDTDDPETWATAL
jgi:hypothetical protein